MLPVRIFHYNDEEKELHGYLEQRGHENVIVGAESDPFGTVRETSFDAAFVGLHPNGIRLLRDLHRRNPDCLVTIVTSDRDVSRAVESMKAGAFDYLLSPLDFAEVERICILMMRGERRRKERQRLQDQLAAATSSPQLIGDSDPMRRLHALVDKVAASSAPALITGQTGTGKELIARLLHSNSARSNGPFVSINCNAIPTTLLESELFGYRKGAFTGATSDRRGLLAQADGGSFFFDEISDLDLQLQGKILRALQQGEIMPLGASSVETVDVRFIAATNRDLQALVARKQFREDLYYRLNVVPVAVPPLCERMEDIAPLTRHFLDIYCRREGRAPLKVSPAVWRWMSGHNWPGNVRELENLCQRAVALTDDDTFDVDVLSLSGSFGATVSIGAGAGLRHARDAMERQSIEQALIDHRGNISRASRALGVSRTTFYNKLRKYGIDLQRGYAPSDR